ncbi:MAG: hypothetical protein AB1465_05315 [Patescibacteria group bacterium]
MALMNGYNDRKFGHIRHYHPDEICKKLSRRGFELKKISYRGHNSKIIQFIIKKLFRINVNFFDKFEQKMLSNPRAINFTGFFRKTK